MKYGKAKKRKMTENASTVSQENTENIAGHSNSPKSLNTIQSQSPYTNPSNGHIPHHSMNTSQQLQLSQLYGPQNVNINGHYAVNSLTFNSDQNVTIQHMLTNMVQNEHNQNIQNNQNQQQYKNVNVTVPNDDGGDDASNSDESSSSFTINDKNNEIIDPITPRYAPNVNTPKITPTITAITPRGTPSMKPYGTNSSDNEHNALNASSILTPTSPGTTKGIKLPKPKTKGQWM